MVIKGGFHGSILWSAFSLKLGSFYGHHTKCSVQNSILNNDKPLIHWLYNQHKKNQNFSSPIKNL